MKVFGNFFLFCILSCCLFYSGNAIYPQESTSNNVSDLIKHFNKVGSDKIVNDGKSSPHGYSYGYGHEPGHGHGHGHGHGSQLEKSKYAHKNLGKTVHKKHGTTDGNYSKPYNNQFEVYKSHSAPASLSIDENSTVGDNIISNSSKTTFDEYNKYNRSEQKNNTGHLNKKKGQIYLGKDFEEFQKKLGYPYDNDVDSDSSNKSVYDNVTDSDSDSYSSNKSAHDSDNANVKGTRQSVSSNDYRSSDSTVFDEWITDPINIKEKLINMPPGSNYSHIAQTQKISHGDEKGMKRYSSDNRNNSFGDTNDMASGGNNSSNEYSQKGMKRYSPSNSYDNNVSDQDERENDWVYVPVNDYQRTKKGDPTLYVKKVGKSTFYTPSPQDIESYSGKTMPHTSSQKAGKQDLSKKDKKRNETSYSVLDSESNLEEENEDAMFYDNPEYEGKDVNSVEKMHPMQYKSKNSPTSGDALKPQYDDDNIEYQTKEDIKSLKTNNSNEYTRDDLRFKVKSKVHNRGQDGIKTSGHSRRQSSESSDKEYMMQKPETSSSSSSSSASSASSASSWADNLNKIENANESESTNARQMPFQRDNEEKNEFQKSINEAPTSSVDTLSGKHNNVAIELLDISRFNRHQDATYFNAAIITDSKSSFKNIFNKKSNQKEISLLKMLQLEAASCISNQRKMLQKEILDKHYCSEKQTEKMYCRTSALHVAFLCSSDKKYCFDIIPKTRTTKKNNLNHKEKSHYMYMTMPNVYNVNALEVLLTNKTKCKNFISILNQYSNKQILTSEHIVYLLSNDFFKKINPILVQHLKNFQETKNLLELGKYYYKALLVFSVFIKPSAKIYYNKNFEDLTSWQIFDLSKELYMNFIKTIHIWSDALLQNADDEIINLSDFLFLKFLNFYHYNIKNGYHNDEGITDIKNIINEEFLFSDRSDLSKIAFMKLTHSILENLARINHVMKISAAN